MKVASILQPVQQDLEQVEQVLADAAKVEFPLVALTLEAILSSGGKRVRPALLLLAAKFHHYDLQTLVPLAAGIEMLHTATLVHDDTIDHSLMRRGNPTLNSVVTDGATILMGDYLFAQSAILTSVPQIPRVTSIVARTLASICDGELRQIFGSRKLNQTREDYFQRIYLKTAALFSGSMEMGAVASRAPEEDITALSEYGRLVGLAFQVVDDIMDFRAKAGEIGKPVGSDLRNGIVTLPVICFLDSPIRNGYSVDLLKQVLEGNGASDDNLEAAFDMIVKSGALDIAFAEARGFISQAKAHLNRLPDNEYRQALLEIADYVVERDL